MSKCGIIILVFISFLLVHSVYQYKYSGYSDQILINLVKENNYSQREYVLYNNYCVTFKYTLISVAGSDQLKLCYSYDNVMELRLRT